VAYSLKVLEPGAADVIDDAGYAHNLFASESVGYTGVNCAATHDPATHKWSIVGNAASNYLVFRFATSTAYAPGLKIFFRAKMKVTTVGATMANLTLAVSGSTSGTVYADGESNPAVGTEYTLFGIADLTGMAGTLRLDIGMSDDVSINGVTVEITEWVALDLTHIQSAGKESTAAAVEAWVVHRAGDWGWMDWYLASGTDQYYQWERMDAHGLTTGDVRHNPTASANIWSPVYVIDANWYTVGPFWAFPSVAGDAIATFRQIDRTTRLLAQSLRLNLRSDIEASITCDMLGDATWQPLCGMTVLLYDGTELLHTGKIKTVTRSRYAGSAKWRCGVEIGTMTEVAVRATYYVESMDYLTSRSAVKRLIINALNIRSGLGILWGRIDTGLADIGEFDVTGRNVADMLTELAEAAGYVWYIDKHRRLHFRSPLVAPASAAHALVDGNGYEDYSNVEYSQSSEQYRTTQVVTGSYDDLGAPVVSRRTLADITVTPPISTDVEACGNEYTSIARNDSIDNVTDAATSADAQLRTYGQQVPCTLSFESGDTDWRPNTDLTVELADLGIASELHFNIDNVELFDADGVHIRSRLTCSQRDPTSFASVPNSGPSAYLANLQTAAQNSVNTVHNGDSSAVLVKHWLTPEGGIAVKLTNLTGGVTIKGTVVAIDTTTDNAFKVGPANSDTPIGFVYNAGVADGEEALVVVLGIAEVLMKNTIAPIHGYVAYMSDTAGRADNAATIPDTTRHWRELGHVMESKAGGTNVLAKLIIHFN
jgi:hypothetical protein